MTESLKSDFSKLAHQLKNLDNATHLLKKLEQPEEAISIYTDKVNLLGSFMKKRDLYFILGTHFKFGTWMIIGLFYPKKDAAAQKSLVELFEGNS